MNNNNKFSIQTDSNGNKYVNVDTDQDIFEGIEIKDYNKIAKMYINDCLRGKTILSNTGNAIIDSKSANKYTNPGKRQTNFIEKMKLTPELKNILKISEKSHTGLPTKDTSKYDNWEYYKFNFRIGDQNFSGIVNIGIDSNGQKHFYEVNNIKKTSGISGISPNDPTGFSVNNISLSNNNVKSDTSSTKYSMQENKNNTQELDNGSFSFTNLPKIKEGHTRLYRGLNNEYNPNYDRSRLDSPNGYDTLTDNYELAKKIWIKTY